jgi:WD40 repeat protein
VESIPSSQDSTGKLGIYLAPDSSGGATVKVDVLDANGCVIASGSGTAVGVKAGETTAPVSIVLYPASVPCGPDAGVPDSGAPSPADGGVADGPGGDAPTGADVPPPVPDGPSTLADLPPVGGDTVAPDLASPADAKTDVAIPNPDVPEDVRPADLPVSSDLPTSPDLGPDGPVDAPPTTLNVLANCTNYTHSKTDSSGKAQDWGIRQLAFSPDGKILISFGEDGRAKLWNVTAAGLAAPSNGLVFSGTNGVYGTISQDGKYVAVGEGASQVKVYDLALSIQFGAPSTKWTLPPDSLVKIYGALRLQFTTDGGHLVVAYSADSRPYQNQLAVWDLGTQQIVRLVKYDYDDWPMAIFPGPFTGAMWVASAATITADAGDYVSTVTLMDVSQAAPSKAQVTMPGTINKMALSPDGTTLAIGFDSGEVSLWDITTKSNIVRLGSPLIVGSSASGLSTYSLAYAPDGKYLAAGLGEYFFATGSVNLVLLQQKVALQKSFDYLPWSVAFAPDGLALAIGLRDFGGLLYCRP